MGFKLKDKRYLKNIDSNLYLYVHEKTNAELLFFSNNDINKSFSITFKTIPYNDNGIFHILEHSVLCGSEKYPVKEPFVELIKGSFNTFINAMTFPDKTIYPVSSKNDEDLKILMDIYLDAVFNPKLLTNDNILKQEGWHYHLENINDNLIYKGVVYNEMKGAYSSVEEILDMRINQSLFKGTSYEFSSGGDPKYIPSITQEEFISTYKHCYHPSNSFITLYGDLDIDNYLNIIDEYLNNYELKDYSEYKLKKQSAFSKSTNVYDYFSEDYENKHYVAFNYILGNNKETSNIFSVDVIDELLLGNSNTEFRKYFIDNGICEDIYSYIQRDRLEVVYNIVLKNIKNEYLDNIENIYQEQLEKFINNSFDKEQIEAIINKNKFTIKEEVNKTSSPKGVNYAIRSLRNWLYDENPFDIFEYDKIIEDLENNLKNNKYESIAKKYLLENNSKCTVKLKATNKKTYNDDLSDYKNSLSKNDLDNIILETKSLIEWQNSEDKKEDLDKIKSVEANKVTLKNPYKATSVEEINDIIFTNFDINTNDILYSKLLFDITSFNKEDLLYSSLLSNLIFNIGTKNKSELEIHKDIEHNLGGISSNINIFKENNSENIKIKFVINAKNLSTYTDKLINILAENTLNQDFSNKQTIYNILLELKLNLEYKFKNYGHSFVNNRVHSYQSKQWYLSELISGFDFYIFVEKLVENFNNQYDKIKHNLLNITEKVFNKNNLIINCTCDKNISERFKLHILNYVNSLSYHKVEGNSVIPFVKKDKYYSEGFYFDTLVQYVGLGFNIDEYHGTLLVLRHILSFDYLWNNVRVKGGAYGTGITINKFGNVSFWSYRDPNLNKTLDVYYNTKKYIEDLNIDEVTLNKYIIGTLNAFDQLLSPLERSTLSLNSYINNDDNSLSDKLVKEIKETTLEKLVDTAKLFDLKNKEIFKCIISSKEKIEENKETFSNIFEIK